MQCGHLSIKDTRLLAMLFKYFKELLIAPLSPSEIGTSEQKVAELCSMAIKP
jgi:hypothetical protein